MCSISDVNTSVVGLFCNSPVEVFFKAKCLSLYLISYYWNLTSFGTRIASCCIVLMPLILFRKSVVCGFYFWGRSLVVGFFEISLNAIDNCYSAFICFYYEQVSSCCLIPLKLQVVTLSCDKCCFLVLLMSSFTTISNAGMVVSALLG